MGTQGVLSVVVDGKMLVKVVTGCDGARLSTVAKELFRRDEVSVAIVAEECDRAGFDRDDTGFIVQVSADRELNTDTDREELGQLYRDTFDDPWFNPRWRKGVADVHRVVLFSKDSPPVLMTEECRPAVPVFDIPPCDMSAGMLHAYRTNPIVHAVIRGGGSVDDCVVALVKANADRVSAEVVAMRSALPGVAVLRNVGIIPGLRFAVSNDCGETCVAACDSAFDALDYLDLQNKAGARYAVVVVRKKVGPVDQENASRQGRREGEA